MVVEKLFFVALKEDRGWYFVEYRPPITSYRFATLNVVVPDTVGVARVADAMETELKLWLARYPIPLMVSSFDGKGNLYNLMTVRASSHLIGFIDKTSQEMCLFWRLLEDKEIPDDALDTNYLRKIYSNIPYKTQDDLKRESAEHVRQLRIGWTIVFVWAVIVPAVVAILKWASPPWVAVLVLVYSLWKAVVKALKMLGKWKKSPREIEKEEEERRMRHHHYHCERNTEGFSRLKLENFEREERENILDEARKLKSSDRGKSETG